MPLDPNTTPTPNNGWPVPDVGQKNWGDEIQDTIFSIDALMGRVSDIGNYDSLLRPGIASILGLDPLQTVDQTVIGAINEVLALAGGPLTGLNSDDSNDIKLSQVATIVAALNRLDAIGYREVVINPTSAVKLTSNITGVTISLTSPQVYPGTAAGIGVLRFYAATKQLTFEPYGGLEDIHVPVGMGGTHILIGDSVTPDQGGIYVDVNAGLLPLTDQQDNVQLIALTLDIDDLTLGDYCIVSTDTTYPNSYHAGYTSPGIFQFSGLTVAPDVPSAGSSRITTDAIGGFLGAVAYVTYLRRDAQDGDSVAFEARRLAVEARAAIFQSDTFQIGLLPDTTTNLVDAINYVDGEVISLAGEIVREEVAVIGTSNQLLVSSPIEDWDDGSPLVICFDNAATPNRVYLPGDETKFTFAGVTVSAGTTVNNSIATWGDGSAGNVVVYYCKQGAGQLARTALRDFILSQFDYELCINGNATDIPIADKSLLGAIVTLASGAGSGVTSLNSQTGAVDIVTGTGITVTVTAPDIITIASKQKGATATVLNGTNSIAVTFATPYSDAAYRIALAVEGTTTIYGVGYSSKTASGFVITLTALAIGNINVDWTTTRD